MSELFVQSLIDIELWNQATWRATAFLHAENLAAPSGIGIVFQDGAAGRKIFQQWQRRLGKVDAYDELRLSIIEGDVPGEEPGYTVHITSDPTRTAARLRAEGRTLDVSRVMITSRMNRMNPAPGSPHLALFSQAYARHGRYFILPVSLRGDNPADPRGYEVHDELSIEKKQIYFRQFGDIQDGDIDSLPFGDQFRP